MSRFTVSPGVFDGNFLFPSFERDKLHSSRLAKSSRSRPRPLHKTLHRLNLESSNEWISTHLSPRDAVAASVVQNSSARCLDPDVDRTVNSLNTWIHEIKSLKPLIILMRSYRKNCELDNVVGTGARCVTNEGQRTGSVDVKNWRILYWTNSFVGEIGLESVRETIVNLFF